MKFIKINTFSSVQVYVACVLVTFFAIRQLGSGYSMRLLKPKLAARVECEFCKAMLFCIFCHFLHFCSKHSRHDQAAGLGLIFRDVRISNDGSMSSTSVQQSKVITKTTYLYPTRLFMYKPPHAQRTLKISSIKILRCYFTGSSPERYIPQVSLGNDVRVLYIDSVCCVAFEECKEKKKG